MAMDIFELYKKCVRGKCSLEELSIVEDWLKEHPDAFESDMLSEMQAMGEPMSMPEVLKQQMLAYFRDKGVKADRSYGVQTDMGNGLQTDLGNGLRADDGKREAVRMRGRHVSLLRLAAAAVTLTAVITGAWLYRGQDRMVSAPSWSVIENTGNGVKLVILPDSSRIWLNAYARIRYTIDADKNSDRKIQLAGEAYFKVRSQTGRSFTVESGNISTRVLGTEFNIEAYPNEAMVRVILEEGKVQVNCMDEKGMTKESRLLEPGQAAVYHKGNEHLALVRTTVGAPQAWIRDEMVLNDIPLADALARIGKRYNKTMVFDSLRARQYGHVKAGFRSVNVEQLLTQLGFACDFKFRKDNNTYTISFNKDRGR